ncbi:cation:proton antiporter domain-containing protein [Halarcobacter bivalviorum]|uniref:cation:proton antiporter domain-containing protein n=1 Tax=Halarcobacter bivalviorum TaxID=663364 RepID=UPI00100AD6B4|nr:cation:proton antiporter [Halarcobacter bivalviorum]RXK04712.1 potassium transporter [Halarcobacter bivalviorum]
MENTLLIIFVSLALATILNLILKKLSISHIIGYILTGTIVATIFNFNEKTTLHTLELIAEFGIVFLMFTIGLEMPLERIKKLKKLLFGNGLLQVCISAIIIFVTTHFVFKLDFTSSLIISLAFSLSSTAIVLSYLKQSKDIYTPYGEKSTAILVFQDLAVIPILLLITFLSSEGSSIEIILFKTFVSALVIIALMFTIGKKVMGYLLQFSSNTRLEELFLASVLSIVLGASLLAHEFDFTYSLGAFIAGMIIAETKYHIKVESDISSYKDLLLGTFFFSVGTKIDISYFIENIFYLFAVLVLVMLIKAVVVYFIVKQDSNKSDSIKAALALCQIGEFSFAVFALASADGLLEENLSNFLILVTVLSMILTPFIINNIYKLSSYIIVEFYESDKITPINKKNHIVICGYGTLGRIIAKELEKQKKEFVIISDNLKHVVLARKNGYMAYFGHLEKLPVIESLKVEDASSIIITLSNISKKSLICEAILKYDKNANLIVKIDSKSEKQYLSDLNIKSFIHAQQETANLIVQKSLEATS